MKFTSLFRAFLILLITSIHLQLAAQDDPKAIFSRAADQLMTDRMELSMDIDVTDQKGRLKEKTYDILMAKFGEVEYTRTVMQKPERARGVTVVISKRPEETGVIEVYTPANGKVRKMQATPENMARVGSDFTLSGYTSQNPEDLDYANGGQQELDGKNCYILQLSNHADQTGMKAEFLVEESSYRIVQIRFFDDRGKNTNITSLSDYQPIPGLKGKIHPMLIEVKDLEENTQTKIRIVQVLHRPDLKEVDFALHETAN